MTDQHAATAVVEHHEDEGHSLLGWVAVTIIVVGFIVGTLFFFLANEIGTWVGAGLIVLGAIIWPIMKLVGFGPKSE